MGWYDANPVNLHPLEPTESAKKWVEYLGDVDEALRMAKADFNKGEYQWVAEITNTIVYADPTNEAARLLCADALEQLGYQAESGPWRNAYLTAALELRHGNQALNAAQTKGSGIVLQMTAEMMFDYMGIIMDKDALEEKDFTINVTLTDVNQQHVLHVKNGVLLVYKDTQRANADVFITCPKNALFYILTNNSQGLAVIPVEGEAELITLLASSMNQFPVQGIMPFNIVEP